MVSSLSEFSPLRKIGGTTLNGAEINAFDPDSQKLFVVSGETELQVVDLSDPTQPEARPSVDLSTFGAGANSVATSNGIIAVALEADPPTNAGQVVFLNAEGDLLAKVEVGALPDQLIFTPDGTQVLVANEGEPEEGINPVGSISIIDLSGGVENLTQENVDTAGFEAFNGREAELRAKGVRIFPDVQVAEDVEPEFISVSPDGTTAFVTLQENNAFAVVDLASARVTDILPLGVKDFSQGSAELTSLNVDLPLSGDKPEGLTLLPDGSLAVLNDNDFGLAARDISLAGRALLNPEPTPTTLGFIDFSEGNTLDPSDEDRGINLQNHPVFGLYQPDAIASFTTNNQTYYITANEGDARDEDKRISELALDPEVFPNAETLQQEDQLGRLQVSTIDGDIDGDGDFDQLFSYGGRSFSIWDEVGNQVFDSGDQIAQITAELAPDLFNADDGDPAEFDSRSDDKGAEPEAVTVGQVGDRTYAFIGLERAGGGVLVYDVTNPTAPDFQQYLRDDADIAPEGLTFISADDSPNGNSLLIITNEESETVSVNEFIPEVKIPDIQGEGHLSACDRAMVTTPGLVTATDLNGFYLQDAIGAGNDQMVRNGDKGRFQGGVGNHTLMERADNDSLTGKPVTDRIVGGPGSDMFLGGEGTDSLLGRSGTDGDILEIGQSPDILLDFDAELDSLGLSTDLTLGQLTATTEGGNTQMALTDADKTLATLQGVTVDLADLGIQAYPSV